MNKLEQKETLLHNLKQIDSNMDSAVQNVKDLFEISTRTLDQLGRTGAFHHIICHKAAASDSGLADLKDVQAKVMYLTLTGDGVFGKGLEQQIRVCKEQKKQLKDILTDWPDNNARPQKRRFSSSFNRDQSSWVNKMPRPYERSTSYTIYKKSFQQQVKC